MERARPADRARMESIAAEVAAALRAQFPQIVDVSLSFGTVEGEDAYLWLTIPSGDPELRRRVLGAAAAKTAPALLEGIGIISQIRYPRAA